VIASQSSIVRLWILVHFDYSPATTMAILPSSWYGSFSHTAVQTKCATFAPFLFGCLQLPQRSASEPHPPASSAKVANIAVASDKVAAAMGLPVGRLSALGNVHTRWGTCAVYTRTAQPQAVCSSTAPSAGLVVAGLELNVGGHMGPGVRARAHAQRADTATFLAHVISQRRRRAVDLTADVPPHIAAVRANIALADANIDSPRVMDAYRALNPPRASEPSCPTMRAVVAETGAAFFRRHLTAQAKHPDRLMLLLGVLMQTGRVPSGPAAMAPLIPQVTAVYAVLPASVLSGQPCADYRRVTSSSYAWVACIRFDGPVGGSVDGQLPGSTVHRRRWSAVLAPSCQH
jgi:hypothetical protein